MSDKVYRLKVKRIPLDSDVIYKKPNFPQFNELHLGLLENKYKLKKNPPKPIFVYTDNYSERKNTKTYSDNDNDTDDYVEDEMTLDELEKAYNNNNYNSDNDEVFSNKSISDDEKSISSPRKPKEYTKEEFVQEQMEEEDEELKERNEKADLLFNFMILKKKYPNADIPEFTEHSDILTMRKIYDQLVRRIHLDSSVENYKTWLIGGFSVMEYVSTEWLGINLRGFAQQQMKSMNNYDTLLIELGEKNYTVVGSRLPVEIRLMFWVCFYAAIFYMQKMMFSGGNDGGDSGLFGLFNSFGQNKSNSQPAKRKNTMRGPTITPNDVEELTRNSSDDE